MPRKRSSMRRRLAPWQHASDALPVLQSRVDVSDATGKCHDAKPTSIVVVAAARLLVAGRVALSDCRKNALEIFNCHCTHRAVVALVVGGTEATIGAALVVSAALVVYTPVNDACCCSCCSRSRPFVSISIRRSRELQRACASSAKSILASHEVVI